MAGRQYLKREVTGSALTLYAEAQKEMDSLYREMYEWAQRQPDRMDVDGAVKDLMLLPWPKLPDLADVTEWPVVTSEITDYRPRKGKKLQRWKRAETAGALITVASLSVVQLEASIDGILEQINEDENASLDEIAEKGAWWEELGTKCWELIPKLEELTTQIERIEFPR